ncbi:MAG: hypothetical protein P8J87_17165 [Verrucomicrobiales bacterium]|nr:hypothetical protein [Verrucomicrobiales bacterium]
MTANEIMQHISPELGREILVFFRESDRPVYKTTLATLAEKRKLRPVFLQRKSVEQQVSWLLETLKMKSSDQVAEHLLQVWLMRARGGMLVEFLDAAEVEHDGEGGVDDLPERLEADKVRVAVDTLLEKYPAEEVALYLQLFQRQTENGWPEIAAELESREVLKSGGE